MQVTIQAQGRFRNKYEDGNTYNSLTVIAKVNENMLVYTEKQVEDRIRAARKSYENLKKECNEEQDPDVKQIYLEDMKVVKYADLLNNNGSLNYFTVDNWYNEERENALSVSRSIITGIYGLSVFQNYIPPLFL